MKLRDMTDEQLIDYMLTVRDPLTTTDLEVECLNRLVKHAKLKNPDFEFFKNPPTKE